MGKNGVTGMIVVLDDEVIHRVFHHRPVIPVFVKNYPSDLEVGDRAFLSESGGAGTLEGEGRISSLSSEAASRVRRYGDELCLSQTELTAYIASSGKTEADEFLVMRLDEPTKYSRPIRCSLDIPDGVLYMTGELYGRILRENL